jgi:hypothetical protein
VERTAPLLVLLVNRLLAFKAAYLEHLLIPLALESIFSFPRKLRKSTLNATALAFSQLVPNQRQVL